MERDEIVRAAQDKRRQFRVELRQDPECPLRERLPEFLELAETFAEIVGTKIDRQFWLGAEATLQALAADLAMRAHSGDLFANVAGPKVIEASTLVSLAQEGYDSPDVDVPISPEERTTFEDIARAFVAGD